MLSEGGVGILGIAYLIRCVAESCSLLGCAIWVLMVVCCKICTHKNLPSGSYLKCTIDVGVSQIYRLGLYSIQQFSQSETGFGWFF
jgi:hypothetical protein